MCKDIQIKEERISSIEYIEFLKRTDLGSQYPKERFEERMAKLVDHVSISLIARNKDNQIVGVLFGLTDLCLLALYNRFRCRQRLFTSRNWYGIDKNSTFFSRR
mgnify:CR=1 FL=1